MWYRKAADIAEKMVASDPSDAQARIDLGVVLMRMGSVMQAPRELRESLDTLDRSEAILSKISVASPDNVSSALQLTLVYEYKARRSIALGDIPAARQNYVRSMGVCETVLKRQARQLSCIRQMAVDEAGLAGVEARLGNRAEALRLSASVLTRTQARAASGPKTGFATTYVPRTLGWSGDTLRFLAGQPGNPRERQLSDWTQAAGFYRQSLAEWTRVDPSITAFYAAEMAAIRKSLAECEGHIH
jgi:hypothetical protein